MTVVSVEDGGVRHVVETRRVIFHFVSSVGVVGVRQWAGTCRALSDAEMPSFL